MPHLPLFSLKYSIQDVVNLLTNGACNKMCINVFKCLLLRTERERQRETELHTCSINKKEGFRFVGLVVVVVNVSTLAFLLYLQGEVN